MYLKLAIAFLLLILVVGKPTSENNSEINNELLKQNLHRIFRINLAQINSYISRQTRSPLKKCSKKQESINLSKITPRFNNIDDSSTTPNINDENDCGYAELLIPKCGIRNVNGMFARSMNGKKTGIFEFPWMIVLFEMKKTKIRTKFEFSCGGSLIHPSVILTVAHCAKKHENNVENLLVRAGDWDLSKTDEMIPAQDRFAKKIIIHEEFSEGSLINDIALIIVSEPFVLLRNVNPICLPHNTLNFDNKICNSGGWGKNSSDRTGSYQAVLKKIDLAIVPSDQCEEQLRSELGSIYKLNPSFLCAGGEQGVDTCVGDGGSPLICPINGKRNQFYQTGIVSWGIGCGNEIPSVYSNVMYLRPWIDSKMLAERFTTDYYTNY